MSRDDATGALRGPRGLVLLGAVGVLVAAVVVLDPGRAGLGRCEGDAQAVLLPTEAEVPDVVGDGVGAARGTLVAAGVPEAAVSERWTVDGTARGEVLAQSGGACGEPLELLVSSGGPLVAEDRLPTAVLEALGGPGEVGPVREVQLLDGLVWHSDEAVSGQCRHVAVARQVDQLLDPVERDGLEVRCVEDSSWVLAEAVAEVLAAAEGADEPDPAWADGLSCDAATWCALPVADGDWSLRATVRRYGEGTRETRPPVRCGPPSAYEVCRVEERADGSVALTLQRLTEGQVDRPVLAREAVVVDEDWAAFVELTPVRRGGVAASPYDGPTLLAVADAAMAGVRSVSPR